MNNLGNTRNTSNPLISRDQSYSLDRKLLTVHSEDRNICKWPNSNNFEIELPEPMLDVQSMRLMDIQLPVNYYSFSNYYQNTKLSFILNNVTYTITIPAGFYTYPNLANEIQGRMNHVVTVGQGSSYINFGVQYNAISQKILFGNHRETFTLVFSSPHSYPSTCNQINIWNQSTNWGMGYYLGFDRKDYTATQVKVTDPSGYFFFSESNSTTIKPWLKPNAYILEAPSMLNILGERTIYMEVDKYNNYMELYPYSTTTTNLYNNDYNGKVNAAFAKIPYLTVPIEEQIVSNSSYVQNIVLFDPPIEKITRLKFKFRYHNGMLVDFQNNPFNFTIAFNRLHNEIPRHYNVRVPLMIE